MINALFILRGFESDGPDRLVLQLLRAWKGGEITVSVVALERDGPLAESFTEEARRLGGECHGLGGGLLSLPAHIRQIRRLGVGVGATLVHAHLPRADIVGREVARALGTPYIVTEHGIHSWAEKGGWIEPVVRLWYRRRWPRSAVIAAISTKVRRDLVSSGIPRRRIAVIRNGIDMKAFSPVSPDERQRARHDLGLVPHAEPLLLTIGALVERKAPATSLETLAELHRLGLTEARLVYTGEGPLRTCLSQRAEALGLAEQVVFTGQVPDPLMALSAADMLLHPARDEPFGLVVAEALACGLPAVVRAGSGPDELVPKWPLAAVVDGEDSVTWAMAIHELRKHQPADGAARRRAFAEKHFSARRMAMAYLRLYEKLQ